MERRPVHRNGNCSPKTFSRMSTVRVAAGQVTVVGDDAACEGCSPRSPGSRAPQLCTGANGSALTLCWAAPFSSTWSQAQRFHQLASGNLGSMWNYVRPASEWHRSSWPAGTCKIPTVPLKIKALHVKSSKRAHRYWRTEALIDVIRLIYFSSIATHLSRHLGCFLEGFKFYSSANNRTKGQKSLSNQFAQRGIVLSFMEI